MQLSTHKEMENLNRQISDYESRMLFQDHNYDFKVKDKIANHTFERRVIYQLKEENDFLRRELEGRGLSISLEKLKINKMQQEALERSKHMVRNGDGPSEELSFYREKNKELEERVNSHIEVNKNLRERLEYLLEESNKYEELEKLKHRITELEGQLREAQERVARSGEENRNLKREMSSLSGLEEATVEYENKLQDNARKLSAVSMEKNALQQEFTIAKIERDNYAQQCGEYENQIHDLTNQLAGVRRELERVKTGRGYAWGEVVASAVRNTRQPLRYWRDRFGAGTR